MVSVPLLRVAGHGSTPWIERSPAASATNPKRRWLRQIASIVVVCSIVIWHSIPVRADQNANEQSQPASRVGKIYLHGALRVTDPQGQMQEVRGIFVVDPQTGAWRKLRDNGQSHRVSADGETLAFCYDGKLWNCDTNEAANPGRIADTGGNGPAADASGRISWMPDSKGFVYSMVDIAGKDRKCETFQVRFDGLTKTALAIPDTDLVEDMSQDGQWVATTSNRHPPQGRGYQVYVMHLDGSGQRRLTKDGLNVGARISPKGRRIAYKFANREGNQLKLTNIDGTDEQTILAENGGVGAVDAFAWSPDGKRLAVTKFDWQRDASGRRVLSIEDDANYRLEVVDVDGKNGRKVELKDAKVTYLGSVDWR